MEHIFGTYLTYAYKKKQKQNETFPRVSSPSKTIKDRTRQHRSVPGIHGKDDTLLFPAYSNILFFIALPLTSRGERGGSRVMRDI